MSFRFSPGTLDSLAGVYAPPKKRKPGSGGGKASAPKAGGTLLAFAVSSMLPSPSKPRSLNRPSAQAKHAFGSSTSATAAGRAIRSMERTARRAPEVVVRITGRQHGGGHVLANFSYISRLGHGEDVQVPLYTSDGDVLRDGQDMRILAQDWQEWEVGGDDRRKGATSISMVLSMPAATDPEALKASALDFAREEFANRSWVAALHVDRDHPHVHLTIARRDHDGRRFHPNRDDLFRYRQRFAQKLRDRGIEANATPARARGIDPTHEPIAAKKMREKGQVPRIDKSRAERAQRFRDRGIPDPVKQVLADRHATVLQTYAKSIMELSSSPSLSDQVTAQTLSKFVETMPDPESNSERAARLRLEAERGLRLVDDRDPIAQALAKYEQRSLGAQESEQAEAGVRPSDKPSGNALDDGVSDRLKAFIEKAGEDKSGGVVDRADGILRRVRERDLERQQRDIDRSKDRGGPQR